MIGRGQESSELRAHFASGRPKLVAVYGRLGIGKTYLVEQVFADGITFRHTALPPEDPGRGAMRAQLKHFYRSLLAQGMPRSRIPDSWLDAFFLLELFLKEKDRGERQVVFLDEIPWMVTPRSGFITAFEGFWNNWGVTVTT